MNGTLLTDMALPARLNPDGSLKHAPMNISVLRGQEALQALDRAEFIERWSQLHADAFGVTVFQHPSYACTWYRSYQQDWEAVLAVAESDGRLLGLLPLALHRRSGQLVCAGAHQAEYQAWLARADDGAAFMAAAWPRICEVTKAERLRLRYLPTLDLQRQLEQGPLQAQLHSRVHARPLLRLDAEELRSSMAKKSNKSRFNRLKKLGAFSFKRLSDPQELDSLLNELTHCYDLRQGAVNHTTPFREDAHKLAFHRALFAAGAPASYVTVTLIDERPVAAFWGAVSDSTAHLGMLIHSPMLAEHSPGKLHVMQLSQQLLDDGIAVLDLTPGGDAWKERFANDHDQVGELTLFASAAAAAQSQSRERRLEQIKSVLGRAGLTPDRLRAMLAAGRKLSLGAVQRRISHWLGFERELRIYRAERALAQGKSASAQVQCNALDALLAFEPGESWQTRDAFLSSALERLERGERAYTVCIDGRLAHCGWLVPRQERSNMSEVGQSLDFPAHSATLYDFYTHPDFRGRGLYRSTLEHMLADAFADEQTEFAYISVLADNLPSRRVIERVGFAYQGSFFWHRRFGKDQRFPGPEFTAPAPHETQT